MAFNHLWGISLRHVALYCGSGYRLCSGGRKRLKKMGELESGDENKGPFPCLVNRSTSCACRPPPLFFRFSFSFSPQLSPHYGTWSQASYRWFLCRRSSTYGMLVKLKWLMAWRKQTTNWMNWICSFQKFGEEYSARLKKIFSWFGVEKNYRKRALPRKRYMLTILSI